MISYGAHHPASRYRAIGLAAAIDARGHNDDLGRSRQMKIRGTVECDATDRPVCVAELILREYPAEPLERLLVTEELRQLRARVLPLSTEKRWADVRALSHRRRDDRRRVGRGRRSAGSLPRARSRARASAPSTLATSSGDRCRRCDVRHSAVGDEGPRRTPRRRGRARGHRRVSAGTEDTYRNEGGVWKIARMRISKVP